MMNSFVKVLSLTAVVVGVTLALKPQPGLAAPNTQQVQVVNTSAQPVPVNGSVAATQNGAWTVGINGTPGVTIANTPNAPIPTQDVDEHGRQPFQVSLEMNITDSFIGTNAALPVPPGKRLVIEHLSALFQVPTGELPWVEIDTVAAGGAAPLFAMPDKMGPLSQASEFGIITRPVLLYADTSGNVTFWRNVGAGLAFARITISGHLLTP